MPDIRQATREYFDYKIIIGKDKELDRDYDVQSIMIQKEVNKIALARLYLVDGDPIDGGYDINDSDDLIPGVNLEIKAGYGTMETIFKGVVIKNTIRSTERGVPLLVVDCKDEAYKMSLTRNYKLFSNLSDTQIIEQIIKKYGLSSKLEDTNITHHELIQFDITDWEWMVKRADRNGKYLLTENGTITMSSPQIKKEADLHLSFDEDILEIDAELDSRTQHNSVKSFSWDANEQAMLESEAAANSNGHPQQGNLSVEELAKVSGETEEKLIYAESILKEELLVLAEAKSKKNRLSKVRGTVKTFGNPAINPGNTLALEKLSARFNGNTFVSGVAHSITEDTWDTLIQFGVPSDWWDEKSETSIRHRRSALNKMEGLHIGVVVKLADEESSLNKEKIKVRIPTIDENMDGIWARVASLYAGNQRGIIFRPELGDEVILGFIDNSPREPIIIGPLHSNANPSPLIPDDANHEKGIFLREGLKLYFNDRKKEIFLGFGEKPDDQKRSGFFVSASQSELIIQDSNENKIKFGKTGISIDSCKELLISSKEKISLSGKEIDIKTEDGKFNLKASGEVNIDGSKINIG